MSSRTAATTSVAHGCPVVLRRVVGPVAKELFFHCRPPADLADPDQQAQAIYRAIVDVLEVEGGSFASVVCETVFLRSAGADLATVRAARQRVLAACPGPTHGPSHGPVTSEIEQAPIDGRACLEVSVQAVIPNAAPLRVQPIAAGSSCECAGCARSQGLRVDLGGETRFYAGGLLGPGENAYEQTLAMFGVAEELLSRAGMGFGDVVRTWIHLRDIDRDYGELNRARRAFFAARGIDQAPASTGIGGGPVAQGHDICLGLYAIQADPPPPRTVMTTPTLNEAPEYGADFARGMKVVETNRVALCVSGTASLDEAGRSAHPGDFQAQARRMLVNVRTLLEGEGATFGDVVSAVTYLKRPEDAARLEEIFQQAGFDSFPNVLVSAGVCRPELLCETEVLAILPRCRTAQTA